jgi:hypothetical protein
MPKLRNVNPLGGVDVPSFGLHLAPGEEFEVDDDKAAALLAQAGNFELVDTSAPKKADSPAVSKKG